MRRSTALTLSFQLVFPGGVLTRVVVGDFVVGVFEGVVGGGEVNVKLLTNFLHSPLSLLVHTFPALQPEANVKKLFYS
jgi:hypothetical protein